MSPLMMVLGFVDCFLLCWKNCVERVSPSVPCACEPVYLTPKTAGLA